MTPFPCAHAMHPSWSMAAALVVAQLRASMQTLDERCPALGVVYLTPPFVPHAPDILRYLRDRLPDVTDWVGASSDAVVADVVVYQAEAALAVMLLDIEPEQFQVFSGQVPLPLSAWAGGASQLATDVAALIHTEHGTPDLESLLDELSQRIGGRSLAGAALDSGSANVQLALSRQQCQMDPAAGVLRGGVSGVVFDAGVPVAMRLCHGCVPMGPSHRVTQADGHVVVALDGVPAATVLWQTVGMAPQPDADATALQRANRLARVRLTRAALGEADDGPPLGMTMRTRSIVGLDATREGVVLGGSLMEGERLTFCTPRADAQPAGWARVCQALQQGWLRQGVSAKCLRGALYVGPAQAPDEAVASLTALRQGLGDVPLMGVLARAQVAQRYVHEQTGLLLLFASDVADFPPPATAWQG